MKRLACGKIGRTAGTEIRQAAKDRKERKL